MDDRERRALIHDLVHTPGVSVREYVVHAEEYFSRMDSRTLCFQRVARQCAVWITEQEVSKGAL